MHAISQVEFGPSSRVDTGARERSSPLKGSLVSYIKQSGRSLDERLAEWSRWLEQRREHGVWPYSRVVHAGGANAHVSNEFAAHGRQALNFGSQDYLSLSSHPAVIEAAIGACQAFGIHSAGSPVLAGRTQGMLELEGRLADVLRKDACAIFPTGWAAGFGVMTGLVRSNDCIVIDRLAHNCLAEGTRHTAAEIHRFAHNDIEQFQRSVRSAREKCPSHGLFVVIESLYSMDSDSPDLEAMVEVARHYDGITILDVAHDFGAMGGGGRGLLDETPVSHWPDIVMGSFSKTFASNGGFVAASSQAIDYLRYYAPSFTFSNALSPVQTSAVNACMNLVFSEEGARMRQALDCNVRRLRAGMEAEGFRIAGDPSPIVPVFVEDEAEARLTARSLEERGLLANLVEFPAVPRGEARFRFQVMRNHTQEGIDRACEIMVEAVRIARDADG